MFLMEKQNPGFPFSRLRAEALRRASTGMTTFYDSIILCLSFIVYRVLSKFLQFIVHHLFHLIHGDQFHTPVVSRADSFKTWTA